MSSEPPPSDCDRSTGPRSSPTSVFSPDTSTPISFWNASAKRTSSSLHSGMPTRTMFACVFSATGLLKCRPHADPTVMIVSTVVPVMSAAP